MTTVRRSFACNFRSAASGGGGGSYSTQVLADSPLLYWQFDATSGTSVADASGNGHAGTLVGTATAGGASLLADGSGRSMSCPGGGSSGASIAQASWMETATFTHEVIIKASSIPAHTYCCGRDDLSATASQRHSLLYLNGSTVAGAVHTTTNEVDFGGVVTAGNIYHLAETYDGTTVRGYLNGTLLSSFVPSGALNLTSARAITVGCPSGSFSGVWNFDGLLDEYAYYGTALAGSRITAHAAAAFAPDPYATAVQTDSPLAYYRLNESSGTAMSDSTANARHGTYYGTKTSTAGLLGAVSSDGASSQPGSIGSGSWMNVAAITIECLIKPSSTGGNMGVVTRYSGAQDWLVWINTSSQIAVRFYNAAGSQVDLNTGVTVVAGTRYHVAATYQSGQARLYVNGAQVASSTALTGALRSDAQNIEIDTYQTNTWQFSGVVDEVALYSGELSAARISAHFAASQ